MEITIKRGISTGEKLKESFIDLVRYAYIAHMRGDKKMAYDIYKATTLYIGMMTLNEFCSALDGEIGEMWDIIDGEYWDIDILND